MPWLLICLGTALKLFQAPFNSIYMGLGKVKEMSKIGVIICNYNKKDFKEAENLELKILTPKEFLETLQKV